MNPANPNPPNPAHPMNPNPMNPANPTNPNLMNPTNPTNPNPPHPMNPANPMLPPPPASAPGTLSALLKDPDRYAVALAAATRFPLGRILASLVAAATGSALYFFAAGFFAGWRVALIDAAKGALAALFAFALCLPSLCVFSCVSGARLRTGQIVAAGAACLATLGLLLAALAPVLWLFAVSTQSASFLLFFSVLLAVLALCFAGRPAGALRRAGAIRSSAGIRVWLAVFLVVALQTVTLLRPILEAPESPTALASGKMFFLEHFFRTLFAPLLK